MKYYEHRKKYKITFTKRDIHKIKGIRILNIKITVQTNLCIF